MSKVKKVIKCHIKMVNVFFYVSSKVIQSPKKSRNMVNVFLFIFRIV